MCWGGGGGGGVCVQISSLNEAVLIEQFFKRIEAE